MGCRLGLLLAAVAALAAAAPLEQEAAVMLRLRQAVWDGGAASHRWTGWHPTDPAHHCSWGNVLCDSRQRIIRLDIATNHDLQLAPAGDPSMTAAACALAALANLDRLGDLLVGPVFALPLPSRVLQAWAQPAALPRLVRLHLDCLVEGPLPELHPGSFPSLQAAVLGLDQLAATLPASWGGAAVLPALTRLHLWLRVEGPLPREWAAGFPSLEQLGITDTFLDAYHWRAAAVRNASAPPLEPPPRRPSYPLPEEWGAGFPRLTVLQLNKLAASGSLPRAWVDGGLPRLTDLSLSEAALSGTLPPALFRNHPSLKQLWLAGNRLSGTLPAEWGESEARLLVLQGNELSGPAFPAAWLQPGSLLGLAIMDVGQNRGLTGTLPESLSWRSLDELLLAGTGLRGTLPAAWCHAPFARSLRTLQLNETAVDPRQPECFNRTMGSLNFRTWGHKAYPLATPTARQRSGSSAAVTLATALPLVAAATLGAAARLLWRRRLRRLQWRPLADREPLLPRDGMQPGAGQLGQGGRLGPLLGRRARLAGLLNADADSGCIELLPMGDGDQPPAELDRRLTWPHGDPAGAALLAPTQLPAAAGTCTPTAGLVKPAQTHHLLLAQAASKQLAASDGSGSAAGSPLLSSGTPREATAALLDQQQRSGTLQLQPGALQAGFVLDEAGGLVAVGEGGRSVVYRARLAGTDVAVKVLELGGAAQLRAVWRELSLLRRCSHERVVPLHGVAIKGRLLLLAMQLMQGGSLRRALQDGPRRELLRWEAGGRQLAADVAQGLAHLHCQLGVVHGDLTSGNVLLDGALRASLADLGLARLADASMRSAAAYTLTHAAPEQLMGSHCTLAADLYGFGVLLVELATLTVVDRRGAWRLPRVPDECPQGVLDLIEDCLHPDPLARCTATEALQRLKAAG